MKGRELKNMGLEGGQIGMALAACGAAAKRGWSAAQIREAIREVIAQPSSDHHDPLFAELARILDTTNFAERDEPAPWAEWGDLIDDQSRRQMENACRLPVAHRGALMPDAHLGYGLPIGGVLATKGAVIPYAVGVDIACRMRLTLLDVPLDALDQAPERAHMIEALEGETRFGIGASFVHARDHEVMDEDWGITAITRRQLGKGRSQLGTSGSGNHFVEYGLVDLPQAALGVSAGRYVALLSHSGSRGPGATVANHYSRLARELHPELPPELQHLSWLDLDRPEGQEYWSAMQLMGRYAAANHEVIHREMVRALGAKALAVVENHHNFAWIEEHDGEQVIVHRKGATPAGKGQLGVIPGSMSTPAYIVQGRGDVRALKSASHGAGRAMSRTQAKREIGWEQVQRELDDKGVELLSAGLDEAPGAYKDIDDVMDAQRDLVDVLGSFMPRIVKMAPAGSRPED